ncbi:TetR/AcrR family transcriptional regulator C-terminal domain-containing protein [Nocardioides lijunqiniae]|uniref:TetR/AcrR family transcriptional regulator C-terminal domain-containing protein n=1 Tax=Nocardioides lijunqiniae TaxID=2760832 RepID=UPI001878F7BA
MPADPDPSLRLLWRHVVPSDDAPTTRRGPQQRLSVDEVVDAAIEIADRDGLGALSMRRLAAAVGLGAMTLYTYVPGRNELVVLMVDQALGRTDLPALPADDLRGRLELVAITQYADVRAHPWLLDVSGVRPWLGPHMADRYEWQLSALEGVGLDDLEMDQAVSLLVGFASNIARAEHAVRQAERESGMTDLEWWQANAETLGEVMAHRSYPLAGRVGQAAGEAYQAASDPGRELEFGLARIIDGLLAHLDAKNR